MGTCAPAELIVPLTFCISCTYFEWSASVDATPLSQHKTLSFEVTDRILLEAPGIGEYRIQFCPVFGALVMKAGSSSSSYTHTSYLVPRICPRTVGTARAALQLASSALQAFLRSAAWPSAIFLPLGLVGNVPGPPAWKPRLRFAEAQIPS
ncbi:unnamed protein product [Symbiodinium sp. CCMP2592]|nr:unnamed protein product [Symbiodinium sp. CCMP2592]